MMLPRIQGASDKIGSDMDNAMMNVENEWLEQQFVVLTVGERSILLLYRVATYITFNVIDDAAMLAFAFS
jgi:hypothetical protein